MDNSNQQKLNEIELPTQSMFSETIAYIIELINKNKIKRLLEIGGGFAEGAIKILKATNVNIVSIEIDSNKILIAKKNIDKQKLEERITLINADALIYPTDKLGLFEMIIIDAAKSKNRYYFEKYSHLLTEKGIIITDNVFFRAQVEQPQLILSRNRRQLVNKIISYNQWLKDNKHFDTVFHHIGDGLAVSYKR